MRNLMMILLVVVFANTAYAVEEREGFSKVFDESAIGTHPILTVPTGKTFVLLQINSSKTLFNIQADSNDVIIGRSILQQPTTGSPGHISHNFPDRCVVFEQGQVLEVEALSSTTVQIVGYFYNCNCPSIPVADLNKDCKVNFADLAIMASNWLTDNTV